MIFGKILVVLCIRWSLNTLWEVCRDVSDQCVLSCYYCVRSADSSLKYSVRSESEEVKLVAIG